jgi:hypothetical protein
VRAWVTSLLGVAIVMTVATVAPVSQAMLNKTAPGRCGGGPCDSMMEIARLFFKSDGLATFTSLMGALYAAFILAAIVATVSGAVQLSHGTPGGGQRLGAGICGVVMLITVTGVVL